MRAFRITGLVLGIPLLLLLLAVVAMPLWLPWAASPALERMGVEYESHERIGYNRFAINNLRYFHHRVEVEAGRAEALFPAAWLWHRWRETDKVDYLFVDDWRVEILETQPAEPPLVPREEPGEEGSILEIFEIIENVIPGIKDWLPRARVGRGELRAGGRAIAVEEATWSKGLLTGQAFDPGLEQAAIVEADLSEGFPFRLRGRTDPFPLSLETEIWRIDDRLAVETRAMLAGNRLEADLAFPPGGVLPERAVIRSEDFRLPSEYLDLEGYEEVLGSVLIEWMEGEFTARLSGEAQPVVGSEGRLPPVLINASARGDLDSFVVDALEIRSPWLMATLSDPVALDYSGELLSDASIFQIAADLSAQPFIDLRGMLRGEMSVSPGEKRLPAVVFDLSAEDVAGFGVELELISLNGKLEWPELVVTSLVAEGAEDSRLAAVARLDLETMEFAEGRVDVSVRPQVIAGLLPEEIGFSKVDLEGVFEGPVRNLRHSGVLAVEDFVHPATRVMGGVAEWRAESADFPEFLIELISEEGRLTLNGSSSMAEQRVTFLFDEARLERDAEPILESVSPARLTVDWADDGPLALMVDDLHWIGKEREIRVSAEVAWPERGTFDVSARGLHPGLFVDFLDIGAVPITVSTALLDGAWSEGGPVVFEAEAEVWLDLGADDEVLFELSVIGEESRLLIERLRATSEGEPMALAEGVLPVALWPGRPDLVRIHGTGEIDFRAQTDPRSRFWEQVAEMTGIFLEDPSLLVEIAGTPYEPSGQIMGEAGRIHLRMLENDRLAPVLEDLRLFTTFDAEEIRFEELSLLVEGHRAELEAVLPMGTTEWRRIVQEGRLPDWERASGRLRIPEARVASFTRFAPGILSPQGTIRADIEMLPGGMFDGEIHAYDLATRPLMPLGAVRDGNARILLRDRTAHLEEISAVIGGERLRVAGHVDIPLEQPLAFDVNLAGRNIPLVRQPGVVVRGDLDLTARSREPGTPLISGRVDLRNSYYLAHLRLMPGGGVATPERRPPFFSVTQEPFADWHLNVDLRGPGFLNVRGPIFQGEISANFNLSGTLQEPRAIGSAMIDAGRLRFPFATMSIDQGEVALRREDPFQPQLFIVASGMTFGYDLTMEITGTAETPIIEFISNPPVSSEQALLMITTGELPREEIRFTTQQRATRFAIYFGRNLLYELTEDDTVADRLVIRSGEQVSEGGRETMAIEYRLGRRWSLIGEYDRFDEYNVGLKLNVYSR